MSFKFKIIQKCWQDASGIQSNGADFLLEKDGWNDYHYHVMYHLHATRKVTKKGNVYMGPIRIMKKGQKEHEIYVLEKDLGKNEFEILPDDYVALSSSIDMYESLNRLLTADERKSFVNQLHLIFDGDSPFYDASLDDDECFNNALLRDTTFDNFALAKGKALMLDVAIIYNLQEQKLEVKFANCEESVALEFSCLSECESELIPNGVIAFIGKNGSGKSTAIYNFAKLLYASPDQRFRLGTVIGKLIPNDLGVSKLFVVSYSPFDNFVLPGIGGEDYRLLLNGMNEGNGRFVFCGIRDVKKEFEDLLQNPNDDTYEKLYEYIRQDETSLKPLKSLAKEFAESMSMIECNDEKRTLWNDVSGMANIKFPEIKDVMDNLAPQQSSTEKEKIFQNLSTGYKFFLHSLSRIIAYIDNNSMILFDEPENHIHPPMLSFMMTSLRMILKKYQSVMLVATHSPVVLQETFASNVFVVRRKGENCTMSHPHIETYGASVSEITTEVFDLTTDVTNYFDAYHSLYDEWKDEEEWESVDDLLNSFSGHLGDKISPQLVSYLIGLYVDEHPNELCN